MNKDNVVVLNCNTRLDLPPDRVLNAALEADLESVTVIGRCKNGESYVASSYGLAKDVVWDLEQVKYFMIFPENA